MSCEIIHFKVDSYVLLVIKFNQLYFFFFLKAGMDLIKMWPQKQNNLSESVFSIFEGLSTFP